MRVSPERTEVAKLRRASGLLQKELADRAGVSVTHLQKVELGNREPSKRLLEVARNLR